MNRKYLLGRRLMLSGVILLGVTHICGYLPNADPNNLPVNWTRITTFIPAWVWVTGWSVIVVVAVWEIFHQKGRNAVSFTVAACVATGTAYLASYVITVLNNGWGSREWFYFGLYTAAGMITAGLLAKVGSLKQGEGATADD